MDEKASRRAFRVSALTAALAIVFTLFFQLSKAGPFREVNPFLDDPYDAVGSIAFQVALLVGVLTFARSLRLIHGELPEARLRFIARGNVLVLGAVLLALVGDTLAVIAHPVAPSAASDELRLALGGMILFAALCASAFAASFPRVREVRPDSEVALADGIDDLAALIRISLARPGIGLPLWLQMGRRPSDRLFFHLAWLSPRAHPWRFACALGLLLGLVVAALQLQEGPSPSAETTLLVLALFVSIEFAATVTGFALFGGYLGLRPGRLRPPRGAVRERH